MKLELGNHTTEVKSNEELKMLIEQYASDYNLGKEEYITNAKLDGKQLVIIGTSIVDDSVIEPIIINSIKHLAKVFDTEYLLDNDVCANGYEIGSLPKLKETFIHSIEEIYNIKIVYVWNEY